MIRQQDDALLDGADLRTPDSLGARRHHPDRDGLVGKTSDGKGAGLKTTVVET
jgi:hypothetical protein